MTVAIMFVTGAHVTVADVPAAIMLQLRSCLHHVIAAIIMFVTGAHVPAALMFVTGAHVPAALML
jgi:hypothetical protein